MTLYIMSNLVIVFALAGAVTNTLYVLRHWRRGAWKIRLMQAVTCAFFFVVFVGIAAGLIVIPAGGLFIIRAWIIVLLALSAAEGLIDL